MVGTITGVLDAYDSVEAHDEIIEVREVKNHAQGHTVSRPQSWLVLVSICCLIPFPDPLDPSPSHTRSLPSPRPRPIALPSVDKDLEARESVAREEL